MISTHVLDTSRGTPAAGVPVVLHHVAPGGDREVSRQTTDGDGRVKELLARGERLAAGTYRLTFDVERYFASAGVDAFYPAVSVLFTVRDATQHHHVPLLLSPYGYATYRGS